MKNLLAVLLVFMFFAALYLFNLRVKRKKCSKRLAFALALVAGTFFSGLLLEALYGFGVIK